MQTTQWLSGAKRWGLRSTTMHKRKRVGIVAKGIGATIGGVQTVTCLGPLSPAKLVAAEHLHHAPRDLRARHLRWICAWVLGDA